METVCENARDFTEPLPLPQGFRAVVLHSGDKIPNGLGGVEMQFRPDRPQRDGFALKPMPDLCPAFIVDMDNLRIRGIENPETGFHNSPTHVDVLESRQRLVVAEPPPCRTPDSAIRIVAETG